MFEDKTIICKTCHTDFVFSVGEQEFFAKHEYTDPVRCPECRAARRINKAQREMFVAICTSCGKETTVPFQPIEGRAVACRNCYRPAGWGDRSNRQAEDLREISKGHANNLFIKLNKLWEPDVEAIAGAKKDGN